MFKGSCSVVAQKRYYDPFKKGLLTRNEKVMDLFAPEIFGEDFILFKRNCQYSVRVESHECVLLRMTQITKWFKVMKKYLKSDLGKRN